MFSHIRGGHAHRIVKFWRKNWREQIHDLEEELIGLSEESDYELIENMSNLKRYNRDYLLEYQYHFLTLLSRAKLSHVDYQSFFLFGSDDHPDYNNVEVRFTRMLDMITKELTKRKHSH